MHINETKNGEPNETSPEAQLQKMTEFDFFFDLSEKLSIQDQNTEKCQQHKGGAPDESYSSTNNDQQESGRTATMLDFFLKIFFQKTLATMTDQKLH